MNKFLRGFLIAAALLLVLGGSVVLLNVVPWFSPAGMVAPDVTATGIQQVRLGMLPSQVINILGKPYTIDSYKGSGRHRANSCPNLKETERFTEVSDTTDIDGFFRRAAADTAVHVCDLQEESRHDRRSTFTYSRPGGYMRHYPMLWVHFDRNAKVDNVFAKEYTLDDYCIYSLGEDAAQNISHPDALRRLFN